MTPSPRWQAPRSSGWMPPPGSSCAIPTRPRTPSRRRSSGPGVTCPRCAVPTASTPGSTACCTAPASMRRAGSGAIASTSSSPRSTHPTVGDVTSSISRPRPARPRLQPPRAGGAGAHRPSSLSRPATAGGRHRARDPARDGEIAPPPSAPVHASGARRRCPTSVGDPGGPSRMTLNDGFDRTVSDWLDEQAGHGAPGYLDEVLTRTTRTRQRPWWSSLERWLPVQSTARFAQVPRMAWLLVVLGLVVALGTAILVVGSPRRPPSPFGPAPRGTSSTPRPTATSTPSTPRRMSRAPWSPDRPPIAIR